MSYFFERVIMKAIKNVLSWVAIIALFAMIFSAPQARAANSWGPLNLPVPKYVDIPNFCGKVREVIWQVNWVPNPKNPKPFDRFASGQIVKDKPIIFDSKKGQLLLTTRTKGGQNKAIIPQDVQIKYLSIIVVPEYTPAGEDSFFFQDPRWIGN